MTPIELQRWQEFRRECGHPWKKGYRPAKLERIYGAYLQTGSVSGARKLARCSLEMVRLSIKYMERRELTMIQAVQSFGYMLEAQGVA